MLIMWFSYTVFCYLELYYDQFLPTRVFITFARLQESLKVNIENVCTNLHNVEKLNQTFRNRHFIKAQI